MFKFFLLQFYDYFPLNSHSQNDFFFLRCVRASCISKSTVCIPTIIFAFAATSLNSRNFPVLILVVFFIKSKTLFNTRFGATCPSAPRVTTWVALPSRWPYTHHFNVLTPKKLTNSSYVPGVKPDCLLVFNKLSSPFSMMYTRCGQL